MEPQRPESPADPMPDPDLERATARVRKFFRMFIAGIFLLAMLIIVIRGIYVVWQVSQ